MTARKTSGKNQAEKLAYSIPEAGAKIGLGRNASYAAAKRGEWPVLEVGGKKIVPIGPFHRMLDSVRPKSDGNPA
jgi:hypothetical protein